MRRFIRTHNAPFYGPGAFAPMPSTLPTAATNGVARTSGYPGTMRVPVTAPELPVPSADPKTAESNVAPNYFLPTIYVAHADFMAPPVPTRLANNVMPMPIPKVGRLPQSRPLLTRLGGITAVRWPRPLIKWPTGGDT